MGLSWHRNERVRSITLPDRLGDLLDSKITAFTSTGKLTDTRASAQRNNNHDVALGKRVHAVSQEGHCCVLLADVASSARSHLVAELQFHVLPEPRRVIVANSLSVAKRLQDRVGVEEMPLDAIHGSFLHCRERAERGAEKFERA